VDAAQKIDLIYVAEALAGRCRRIRIVVTPPDVNTTGRANPSAQLTADALLHPVFVSIQDVAAMKARRLWPLLFRILLGNARFTHLIQSDPEPT
jgi:hypothetical protein